MAHDQDDMGSNPGTVYWMNISNFLAITLKETLKIKVAKWGTPKYYLKNKQNKLPNVTIVKIVICFIQSN